MDDLISRPLPDLVALLPILQARQTWLQQKHTELAGAALQLENTLSPPPAGLVSPQTTGPVSFQFDDPLPPNPHEWLSRFHAYVLSHPRVQSFWSTYASRYHCATWQSITYDLLSSFAIDARRVVFSIPHDSWRPRYNWFLSLTQTLNADTVIDGGPLPPNFPQTYVTLNDALNPVSSAPSETNSASTVPSMNAFWCVQPSTPTTAAQWFFDRLSSQLPTTILIVVPTGHALQSDLTSHPSVSWLSEIPHFTAIPQSLNMSSSPYSLPVTLFLAHIGSPLPPHQIVSMLGPICRKNSATLYPLPPQWVQPTSRQRMRDLFWSKWHAQTAHARDMSSSWTHSDWCAFLQQRANLLRLAPQPHLRRLWNFRRYRQCQDFGKCGTWIYALFSISSKRVYVGQTGALGLPKAGVTRFRQHIRACNSYTTLYGHKHCRELGSIYPMMARTGFENWGMILLEHCPPNRALHLERAWMRRLTPTLNVRDVPVYSRRWELLLRGKLAETPQQRLSVNSNVQSIVHNCRQTTPLAARLALLSRVRRFYSPEISNHVFQKVQHQVHQSTGLKILQRMPITIPTLRHIEPRTLRRINASYISRLPIP